MAVLQHTTEMAELEMRTAQAQRETQRAQQRQKLDQLRTERLALEELRKAGRKFLRENPAYGERWIDRYGSDPDLIEQVGLFALRRGGVLPPPWTEMQHCELLQRIRSLGSHQEWWNQQPALPPSTAYSATGEQFQPVSSKTRWIAAGSLLIAVAVYVAWATRRWWSPAASLSS